MARNFNAAGSDHAGYGLKMTIMKDFPAFGWNVLDLGTNDTQLVDFPSFGSAVAFVLREGEVRRRDLNCGSEIRTSVSVNRYAEVRAALANNVLSFRMARKHHDASDPCFGRRIMDVASPATAFGSLRRLSWRADAVSVVQVSFH